ncbi:MAG: hypothetical protein JSR56_08595 [Proteobacteria bacterium]|nr:hypothetical protein [Pseudomonadota bacterium]
MPRIEACMRAVAGFLSVFALGAGVAFAAQAAGVKDIPPVMGWVPAYGIDASMQALDADPAIGKGLTRIGLQFWNPSANGRGLVLAPVDGSGTPVGPAAIARVRNWAHARHIKVLLTVYNNSETTKVWNWDLARRAFKDQRTDFVRALVAEVRKYKLDGIDIDLEGDGFFDSDRAAFAAFVDELSRALHAEHKLLTVDSFHSPCFNAPNMSWWADWRGKVDAIHSMGYADLYEASEETFTPPGKPVCEHGAHIFKYSWQLAWGLKAGFRPDQIVMGLPTDVDHWGRPAGSNDAITHLREVQALGAGIALWDLQLAAQGWRSHATWEAVRALREHPGSGWKALVPAKP